MRGTFTIPVDVPAEDYDPWALPYGKVPPGLFAKTIQCKFPLRDFREEIFGENYSIDNSKRFLRERGFTAVKHKTSLDQFYEARRADFCDAQLANEVYYPEVKELVKNITGCAGVCVTDSIVRVSDADSKVSDSSWNKKLSLNGTGNTVDAPASLSMHKASPSPPARLPHWDSTALGARQSIRQWSEEMINNAQQSGILSKEDALSAPHSSTSTKRDCRSFIEENYDGPRYASLTVWRPLTKVTRDPLAMAPLRTVEQDSRFAAVPHQIKQPGVNGDWFRELATLKAKDENVNKVMTSAEDGVQWHYISNQDIDEVLLIKSFDSAALPSQRKSTGEAGGVAHASPDVGEEGFGDARASIEVRVIAFW